MKLEGEITVVEYLRGGTTVGIHLDENGDLSLRGLTKEESAGMRAGNRVVVELSVTEKEEEKEEEPLWTDEQTDED